MILPTSKEPCLGNRNILLLETHMVGFGVLFPLINRLVELRPVVGIANAVGRRRITVTTRLEIH